MAVTENLALYTEKRGINLIVRFTQACVIKIEKERFR